MGLFDKIKDNAKSISIRAIEETNADQEDFIQPEIENDESFGEMADMPAEQASEPELTEEPAETETKVETNEPTSEEKTESKTDTEPETPKATEKEKSKKLIEPISSSSRKSKITEVPKTEANNPTSYVPSYKMNADISVKTDTTEKKPDNPQRKNGRVIDVTPKKTQDQVKQAIYARERAALTALSSQRRLDGSVALYVTSHMNFKIRVYINRIEYIGSFGRNVLPIEKIAWVKLRAAGTGVILETTEGKRIVMVVKPSDRLAFADAIMKVQTMQPKRTKIKDTQTVRIDQLDQFGEGIDEIEKLAKLFDKGIITQEEFDAKKKKILGI